MDRPHITKLSQLESLDADPDSLRLDEDRVLTVDRRLDRVAPLNQELLQLGVVWSQVGCLYHHYLCVGKI